MHCLVSTLCWSCVRDVFENCVRACALESCVFENHTNVTKYKNRYEHIGMFDAASTARALVLGALNRYPVIAYPRFQINSLLAFYNLMPRTYDALMLLSANSDPCTDVPFEALALFSCAGKIWSYL